MTATEDIEIIEMFSFLPFNGISCGDVNPIKLNEFNGTSMAWVTEILFPKKFRNLRRCSIAAGSVDNQPGTIIEKLVNGSLRYHGFEVDFAFAFASILNFSLNLKILPSRVNTVYPNKTATGLMKAVKDGTVEFIFGIFSIQQLRMEVFTETRSFYNDRTIVVIPPPMLIGTIEKFFLPFELYTWISVGVLLLIACAVITLLKFVPQKLQDFVLGSNIRTEYLNVLNVLLGGSQSKLPSETFQDFC